ncbi:MAG: flagellar hook capping protein [Novosphingobium sp.]|nr:flagellar hook capping protein [Novosphingobium sp.]MBX9645225.1 flagellar hook capping protein [Novosphingobium sp.]
MQVAATSAALVPLAFQSGAAAASNQTAATAATNAFGLNFESLLKIILTQLTYQDPLKPMDNFQFVSQLAQFSQIQQGQVMSDKLQALLVSQNTLQSTALIGRVVDISANGGAGVISGTVSAITFQNGDPRLTIRTPSGQTINNIAPVSVTQVRGAN